MARVKAKEAYGAVGRSAWLDVDWESHRRWLKIDDRWVNFVDIGEGPVLIFIHGLAGCWQNWLENIPYFARNHRVIAMDLPGFGESEMPTEEISISGYGRTVDALCEALGIDSGVIIGNSMGGFIGAELAIHFPARVERLCLVGAAGLSIENLRTERKRGHPPPGGEHRLLQPRLDRHALAGDHRPAAPAPTDPDARRRPP